MKRNWLSYMCMAALFSADIVQRIQLFESVGPQLLHGKQLLER
jgi:hypothetical protein